MRGVRTHNTLPWGAVFEECQKYWGINTLMGGQEGRYFPGNDKWRLVLFLHESLQLSLTHGINVKKLQLIMFIHMLTATDLRTSKTVKIKKVILLYCCTLTYDDVQ